MKNLLTLLVLTIVSFSCSEVPITIDIPDDVEPISTDLLEQPRIVLVDEFTGVACVECPDGSEALETLLDIHGEQLVVVAIHGGFWSRPFAESVRDLKNDDGVALINLFTEPLGYPAALINRKQFDDIEEIHVGKLAWPGKIKVEKEIEPIVALGLEAELASNNEVLVRVEMLQRAQSIPEGLRLSIGITESNIIEAQKRRNVGTIVDYSHQHVLRDMFTDFRGDLITEELSTQRVTELEYRFTLPDDLVIENAEIFAAIHSISPTLDVYQANKTKITQ